MARDMTTFKIVGFILAACVCIVIIVVSINNQQPKIEEQIFFSSDGKQVHTFYREPVLYCYDGVVYIAPASNRLAVKFNKDGSVATCDGP